MTTDTHLLVDVERFRSLPTETVAIVRAYQRASKADATVRAYTGDAKVIHPH